MLINVERPALPHLQPASRPKPSLQLDREAVVLVSDGRVPDAEQQAEPGDLTGVLGELGLIRISGSFVG